VSLDNLMDVRRAGEAALAAAGASPTIDLAGLAGGNSAAVAVLMAWFRAARAQNKNLVFTGPPERLWKIIQLSGMATVLPLAEPPAGDAGAGLDVEQRGHDL
jgi:ABC-type transporter Mla MlaB component